MSETEERIVTIFGGSKCREGDPEYAQALRVGALLADSGFTVCTGGYAGVMEAASRGAHERGGRVLGITMNQFKSEPNRYLTEKVPSEHFYERLQRLITQSVGYIALRGGMGTVTEISLVWNKLQTRGSSIRGHWCCSAIAGRRWSKPGKAISPSAIMTFRFWISPARLKRPWRL